MKSCWIFFFMIFGAFCDEKLNESWTSFKHVFKKQYTSSEEELKRREIWESHVDKIRQHNLEVDLGLHSYTMKMNRFGDLTHQEFKMRMNGLKRNVDVHGRHFDRYRFLPSSHIVIPDAVDWRTQGYVTSVKDQGECGSCWAFSATGSLEGQTFAKTKKLVSLSEQNLVDCSTSFGNNGCNGGLMNIAFEYIKQNNGIDTEDSYPYQGADEQCRFKSDNVGATDVGFAYIKANNETDLTWAIAAVGPISVGIDASQDSFQFYHKGVYDEPNCSSTDLDHGVLAVGYGVDGSKEKLQYYIVKNSWSSDWGDGGYILMSRNKNNQCGIASQASYPLV